MDLTSLEAWFVTGSQSLYGEDVLRQVADNSRHIVEALSLTAGLPVRLVFQPVVTTPESILKLAREANAAPECVGLVCWMHTFSPGKMWIAGLRRSTGRFCTCTRSSTATCPGPRSTWTT